VSYEQFLTDVAARIGVDPPGRASLLVKAVLATLSARLSPDARARLAAELPSMLAEVVLDTVRVEHSDATEFVRDVATGTLNTTPEQARYGTQAVLSALAAEFPETVEQLRAELPSDYDELFEPPGGGPPPELAATAAEDVPTELTDAEVQSALRRLPGWQGDRHALTRTVSLPPGLDHPMLARIHAAEREMQHHAVIEQDGSDTTFRVWTHSVGLVTELDVRLAARISEAIEAA
jgi:uncharacterized protein (DUF2267 family)/pterin-4a-carbinolamine dehydratase